MKNHLKAYIDSIKKDILIKDRLIISIISFGFAILYATMFSINIISIVVFLVFYNLFFSLAKGIFLKKYKKNEIEILKEFIYSLIASLSSGLNIEKSFFNYFEVISKRENHKFYNIFRNLSAINECMLNGNSIIYAINKYKINNFELNNVMQIIKCNIETGNDLSKILYNQY